MKSKSEAFILLVALRRFPGQINIVRNEVVDEIARHGWKCRSAVRITSYSQRFAIYWEKFTIGPRTTHNNCEVSSCLWPAPEELLKLIKCSENGVTGVKNPWNPFSISYVNSQFSRQCTFFWHSERAFTLSNISYTAT